MTVFATVLFLGTYHADYVCGLLKRRWVFYPKGIYPTHPKTMFKKLTLALFAAALSATSASAVFIQLVPFDGTVVQSNYIEFTSDNDAQHFEELDTNFVVADLIFVDSSGQINTNAPGNDPIDTSAYKYMVVRYQQRGPAADLMGAFDLNGTASVTYADLGTTNPVDYDYFQVFLYNGRVEGNEPVPEGGTTVALLGVALAGIGIGRRLMAKKG